MKKSIYKLLTGSLIAFMVTIGIAYAQSEVPTVENGDNTETVDDTISDVKEAFVVKIEKRIEEMKVLHQSLKEKVLSGEITKEEAISAWKDAIQKIRDEKKLFFDERMERIKERFSKIRERNPELANKLQAMFDVAQSHRAEISLKRKEVAKMLVSGEITKEEAQMRRKEDLLNFRTRIQEEARKHGRSLRGGRDDDNDSDIENDRERGSE